jgi:hypothetical protein
LIVEPNRLIIEPIRLKIELRGLNGELSGLNIEPIGLNFEPRGLIVGLRRRSIARAREVNFRLSPSYPASLHCSRLPAFQI